MITVIDYAFVVVFAVLFILILLAVREARKSGSRVARTHPLWYLWRRGPWWTRTITLLILFALLLGLELWRNLLAL